MKINRNDQKGPSFPRKSLEASEQATDAVKLALKGQTKTQASKSMNQRKVTNITPGFRNTGSYAQKDATVADRLGRKILG